MADASTPVLSLPGDILLYLAAFFRPSPAEVKNGPELDDTCLAACANIPAVCRRWREICLESPSYWSCFVLPKRYVHPKRMLARVRDAPLDIYIEVSGDATIADQAQIAADLSLLNEHDDARYVRSFSLHSHKDVPIAGTLLESAMQVLNLAHTRLEHLYFHDGHPPPSERVKSPAQALVLQSPYLSTFTLRGHQRLDWSPKTCILRQLTHLYLDSFNFAHMCGALADMPQLQTVFVDLGDGQLAQEVDFIPSPKSLSWPALKELTLQCHPIDVPVFWNALNISQSVRVTFIIIDQSPFVSRPRSRTLLESALSMFFPKRGGDTSSPKLNCLSVPCREMNGELLPVRTLLDFYAEGSEEPVSYQDDEDGRVRRMLGRPAMSFWIETKYAYPEAMRYLGTSFSHLDSLHIGYQDDPQIIYGMLPCVFHMSALQRVHIQGGMEVPHLLRFLIGSRVPGLRYLIIEILEGVARSDNNPAASVLRYLDMRFDCDLPDLEYLELRGCDMDEDTELGLRDLVRNLAFSGAEDL
ncbi:unnamed protein product [Peniophora sp. CBMAI 1063]|nr:unnamed protein product [Peniophora sp. CBMAI 1063]